MNTLWMIVGCGVLAIVYGIWATHSVLAADQGSKKMQEISAAVREGAQAYLKRQYTTIGIVGVVIFFIIGYTLGWLVAVGFADRRHPVGRHRLHRHERVGARQRARRTGRHQDRWPADWNWPSRPAPSPACWSQAWRSWASRSISASSSARCNMRRTTAP